MKNSLLFTLLCCICSIPAWAQFTFSPLDSCNFDYDCSPIFIMHDTLANNIWQIGVPQKTFFDSAYSSPNALVTDTVNPYPVSNHSYFDIRIPDKYVGEFVNLSFYHKYQTDTFIDGGYLEVTYDSRETWINIIDDIFVTSDKIYKSSDTLFSGISGFSGTSEGWIHTTINFLWGYNRAKNTEHGYGVYVRFNFISDSVETDKAGWMIDNIYLEYAISPYDGIGERTFQNDIKIFPNPADNLISVKTEMDDHRSYDLELFNILGQKVMEIKNAAKHGPIDISALKAGIYIVYLKAENQNIVQRKFVKR